MYSITLRSSCRRSKNSQVAVSYFKAFASYLEIPKQGWEKFHEPYKDNADFAPAKTVEVNTVDHILPGFILGVFLRGTQWRKDGSSFGLIPKRIWTVCLRKVHRSEERRVGKECRL